MKEQFQKLVDLRNEYEYSYQDMADKLGISKCYYWQLEHKKRRLYYEMAKRIAKIFDRRPDEIFYEDIL